MLVCKTRQFTPEARWRLRSATLHLVSMGLPKASLAKGFDMIRNDASMENFLKDATSGAPDMTCTSIPLPLVAIDYPGQVEDNASKIAEILFSEAVDVPVSSVEPCNDKLHLGPDRLALSSRGCPSSLGTSKLIITHYEDYGL